MDIAILSICSNRCPDVALVLASTSILFPQLQTITQKSFLAFFSHKTKQHPQSLVTGFHNMLWHKTKTSKKNQPNDEMMRSRW